MASIGLNLGMPAMQSGPTEPAPSASPGGLPIGGLSPVIESAAPEFMTLGKGQSPYDLWKARPEDANPMSFDSWLKGNNIARNPEEAANSGGKLADPTELKPGREFIVDPVSLGVSNVSHAVTRESTDHELVVKPGGSMWSMYHERDISGKFGNATLEQFCHSFGVAVSADDAKLNKTLINPKLLMPGQTLYAKANETVNPQADLSKG